MSSDRRTRFSWGALALITASIWLSCPVRAQVAGPEFDAFIGRAMRDYAVPGAAVVVVRADRVLLSKGYGIRRAGAPEAVDENTRFQIASVSKFVTATAVASLVDRGVVSWDAPVRSFSPDTVLAVPYASETATLRDYFAHRTGLPAYGGDLLHQLGYSPGEIIQRARYLPFDHSFRERWAYSNFGIFLGEAAAAQAGGMTAPELVSRTIFQPLGMARSGPTLATLLADANRAAGHGIDGAVLPYENVDGFGGAGALVSTGADIARWMRMLLGGGAYEGGRVLTNGSVQAVFAASMVQGAGGPLHDPNDSAGLGCESYQFLGTRVIEKNGALNGVRTIVTLIPERGIGIAVLANKQLTVFPEAVRAEFLERELGPSGRDLQAQIRGEQPAWHALVQVPTPPPGAVPLAHGLDRFIGRYSSMLYGVVSIERRGETLEAAIGPAGYTGHLSHWSGDTFLLTFDNPDAAPGLLQFEFRDASAATGIKGVGVPGTLTADYGRFDRIATGVR